MLVKELIEKLKQMDKEKQIIIKFALDREDEIGYVLEPKALYKLFDDEVVLVGEHTATKEDCDFIGQVDLKEAIKSKDKQIEELKEENEVYEVYEENFKRERRRKEDYRRLYAKYYLKTNKQHKEIEEQKNIITSFYESKAININKSNTILKIVQEQYRMQGRVEIYEELKQKEKEIEELNKKLQKVAIDEFSYNQRCKVIDAMAKCISRLNLTNTDILDKLDCANKEDNYLCPYKKDKKIEEFKDCSECIKQYFESKVKS